MKRVTIFGDAVPSGVYLLRLTVAVETPVQFGHFAKGRPVTVPAGVYVYVGSAMGRRGASTLARRLLRHTTRRDGPPQKSLPDLMACLQAGELSVANLAPSAQKRLFWHVDYLLEETAVTLTHIIALRTNQRLENELARWLAGMEETAVLLPGLGASDAPGATHLLRVPSTLNWWRQITAHLADYAGAADGPLRF